MATAPPPPRKPGSAAPESPEHPRRLVVIADSLSFHGPEGPVPLADERLYPNRLARELEGRTGQGWSVATVARAGWGYREVWLALQTDVHLQQQVLLGADAVVLAAGSSDALAVGVPRPLYAVVPFIRPTGLRRRVRRTIQRAHPWLVRATAGRVRHTPASVHAHALRKSMDAVRLFAPHAAMCAYLPSAHRAGYYARWNPHLEEVARTTRTMAEARGIPVVDLAALGRPWLTALNPDGMHWPWGLHTAVAEATARALSPQVPARP